MPMHATFQPSPQETLSGNDNTVSSTAGWRRDAFTHPISVGGTIHGDFREPSSHVGYASNSGGTSAPGRPSFVTPYAEPIIFPRLPSAQSPQYLPSYSDALNYRHPGSGVWLPM
jgi:hypothetical protein